MVVVMVIVIEFINKIGFKQQLPLQTDLPLTWSLFFDSGPGCCGAGMVRGSLAENEKLNS